MYARNFREATQFWYASRKFRFITPMYRVGKPDGYVGRHVYKSQLF